MELGATGYNDECSKGLADETTSSSSQSARTMKRKAKSASGIDSFGWGSCWEDAYYDMLDVHGKLGQHIKWVQVEDHITYAVSATKKSSSKGKRTPLDLWGDIRNDHSDESIVDDEQGH